MQTSSSPDLNLMGQDWQICDGQPHTPQSYDKLHKWRHILLREEKLIRL